MDATVPTRWQDAEREILQKLDLITEAEALGVIVTSRMPNASGYIEVRSPFRDDANPSAGICVRGSNGSLGRFHDFGGDGVTLSFWDLAAKLNPSFGDWREARAHYASIVGVTLPNAGKSDRPVRNGQAAKASRAGEMLKKLKRVDDRPDWLESFAAAKPPISVEAIRAAGGKCFLFHRPHWQHEVIAFPVRIADEVSGVILYLRSGGKFPALGRLPERKTHIIKTAKNGWAMVGRADDGRLIGGGLSAIEQTTTVWRVEGLPDLLALASVMPAGHAVISNISGATGDSKLPMHFLEGKQHVFAIGDTDTAGQAGAERFAKQAARHAADVRIVQLPYEVSDDHGRDVRDFLNDAGSIEELIEIAEAAEPVEPDTETGDSIPSFDGITNAVEGGDGSLSPLPMASILEQIDQQTSGQPYRVGESLFAAADEDRIRWLPKPSDVFAWLGVLTGSPPRISERTGFHTKNEIFAQLKSSALEFDSVETIPHEPPIPGAYYACRRPDDGDGSHWQALLDRFTPETEYDADLIKAMFASVFWGGPPGGRPVFALTAHDRGHGKTTVVKCLMELCGGGLTVFDKDSVSDIPKRILSGDAMSAAVVLLDNLKSHKFSSGEIEAMVTAPRINGWRLYQGNASRTNNLLWAVTVNGPSFARDMATRTVFVRLGRPTQSGDWQESTMQFIRDHREQIIGDILAFLKEEPAQLAEFSRWGQWERDVLARLPEPEDLQRVIRERQDEFDAESGETADIEERFRSELERLDYDVDRSRVAIPSSVAAQWMGQALGERVSTTKSTNMIRQRIGDGSLRCLRINPSRRRGRGFIYEGSDANADTPIDYDLEARIAEARRPSEYREAASKVTFHEETF